LIYFGHIARGCNIVVFNPTDMLSLIASQARFLTGPQVPKSGTLDYSGGEYSDIVAP
jgi:hypothetical protein